MGEVGTATGLPPGGVAAPVLTPQAPCIPNTLFGSDNFNRSRTNSWSGGYWSSASTVGTGQTAWGINGTRGFITAGVSGGAGYLTVGARGRKNNPGFSGGAVWEAYWEAETHQAADGGGPGTGGSPGSEIRFSWDDGNGEWLEAAIDVYQGHLTAPGKLTIYTYHYLDNGNFYIYDLFDEYAYADDSFMESPYGVRVQVEGQTVRGRAWSLSGSEPSAWDLVYTVDDGGENDQTKRLKKPTILSLTITAVESRSAYVDNFSLTGCSPQ